MNMIRALEYDMQKYRNHAFVICAYGSSKYLGACIRSLLAQTVESRILMVTSTPNKYIRAQANRYGIPLYVNDEEGGIASDWNFGYRKAKELADYVTIVHQDDIYQRCYTQKMLGHVLERGDQRKESDHNPKKDRPLILFCNYSELRNGRIAGNSRLLFVKRLMLLPLMPRRNQSSVRIRRGVLSMGNPIMCPTVMYCTKNLPDPVFAPGLVSNLDWEAWEKLSRMEGSFIYEPKVLLLHRIHEESATSSAIRDQIRKKEDMFMFRKFWPEGMARFLIRFYIFGERSNQCKKRI